ncbi:hypothetical protein H7X87_01745 [Acetobacteraceae bacterium]|nr:hypothetical protein [Candidatus Parcubacteria bacterium]
MRKLKPLRPIKGCGVCCVFHTMILSLRHRHQLRKYFILNAQGVVVSDEDYPVLQEVRVLLGYDQVIAWRGNLPHGEWITLNLAKELGENKPIVVNGEKCATKRVGNEKADSFFSTVLGFPCELVCFPQLESKDSRSPQ